MLIFISKDNYFNIQVYSITNKIYRATIHIGSCIETFKQKKKITYLWVKKFLPERI